MNGQRNIGIIVQARMGSSRLPGKMEKEFYDGKSLLEVVLNRTEIFKDNIPVIVATTDSAADNFISEKSLDLGYQVFRGSEQDVMSRFIGAAEKFEINQIIRICADNPFLQPKYIERLVSYNSNLDSGYVGFRLNGSLPAIRTHFGFFPELVSLKALKLIYSEELKKIYREHVTNYFYSDENKSISTGWIDLVFPNRYVENARLTIDTERDFIIANSIYKYLKSNNLKGAVEDIFKYFDKHPETVIEMKKSIVENEK